MASAAGPFPIFYTPDVHNFYIKQKHEFHFNQKSDNDFLMFLLDTAVRVISIVQHLAPVIEAVSDASSDIYDIDDLSPENNLTSSTLSGSTMEVDAATVPPLSAELEQINQEITNSQISSKSQPSYSNTASRYKVPSLPPHSEPEVLQIMPVQSLVQTADSVPSLVETKPIQSFVQTATPLQSVTQTALQNVMQTSPLQSMMQTPPLQNVMQTTSLQSVTQTAPLQNVMQTSSVVPPVFQASSVQSTPHPMAVPTPNVEVSIQPTVTQPTPASTSYQEPAPLAPNVPAIQHPTSAQSSENLSTILPSATQPIAEAPPTNDVKTEQPVPEVIEIKEEMDEFSDQGYSNELLEQDSLQQLMSSISGADGSSGLQNFVPTATPSSLPPSFLDRGAKNPLSMVGSLNTGDGPGPSGIHVPNIPESMMKNINDAGLNVSSIKGQANPIFCRLCGMDGFTSPYFVKLHIKTAHSHLKDGICEHCGLNFVNLRSLMNHVAGVHLNLRPHRCEKCDSSYKRKEHLEDHIASRHMKINRETLRLSRKLIAKNKKNKQKK